MKKYVWDKTNIGENYPGTTLPLTYSFIRYAYAQVYRNFLLLMGMSEKRVDKERDILDNMLGYIHGEVYYNINNWYKFIEILPGYSFNKEYFENMLQPVKKKKSDGITKRGLIFGLWNNKGVVLRLLYNILFIERSYKIFDKKYEELMKQFNNANWKDYDNFELAQFYSKLQSRFFSIWAYTIINDFKVMIYYGMLTDFVKKYFPKDQNNILRSIYGLKQKPKSVAPLLGLLEIADIVHSHKKYRIFFKEENNVILESINKRYYPELSDKISGYLRAYGERSFNELKLEDTSFNESPEELITILKYYIDLSQNELDRLNSACLPNRVSEKLNNHSLGLMKQLLFTHTRKHSIAAIYKREEYRLKRGKVFYIAKQIFREFGRRMVNYKVLHKTDDVYYLYSSEILDLFKFHRLPQDYRAIVMGRKKMFKKLSNIHLPRRYTTEDYLNVTKSNTKNHKSSSESKKVLKGKITSRGNLEKLKAVVMLSFDATINVKGKVLVTRSTDPGWTVLFPLIKGIVIDHGGVLSHASIVARELGIPCIIVEDATRYIHNDDIVSINPDDETLTIHSYEDSH